MIRKLLKSIMKKGLRETSKSIVSYLYDQYFDAKYNIDTSPWVEVSELDVEESKKEHAVLYQATRVLPFRKLFEKLKISEENTLVDIGCGKGRVLLLASEFGFEDVIGVEFSKLLCDTAEKNILNFKYKTQTKTSFLVINADAAEYQYNDDEDVFFLYNPFDEEILEKVLQNISKSLKRRNRKILMIYANPVHRKLIESTMHIIRIRYFYIWGFEFVVYEVELEDTVN